MQDYNLLRLLLRQIMIQCDHWTIVITTTIFNYFIYTFIYPKNLANIIIICPLSSLKFETFRWIFIDKKNDLKLKWRMSSQCYIIRYDEIMTRWPVNIHKKIHGLHVIISTLEITSSPWRIHVNL